jgi:flagellar biosynthesis/type III secretory pathway chaperone
MEMTTLESVLAEQLRLFEALLAVLNQETSELAEIHLDAMSEINCRKEELTSCIDAHTIPLRKAIGAAVSREGLPAGATLRELAARSKAKGNREISRLHEELNNVSARIQQVAAVNRDIAERFASSVTTSLTLLTRLINQSNTYGASGGYQQQLVGSVMVNREA